MKNKKGLSSIMLAAFFLLGCQGTQTSAKNTTEQAPQQVEKKVATQTGVFPDFTVKGLDEKEKALKDYRGKILILDLFATWCPPCRMEIPHFVELQNKYRETVSVVGLAYDQSGVKTIKDFAAEMKINYDVYWGSEEIANHVGLRGIPHTLVIDAQGNVYRSYVGYRDKSVFEADIQALSKTTP